MTSSPPCIKTQCPQMNYSHENKLISKIQYEEQCLLKVEAHVTFAINPKVFYVVLDSSKY